MFANFPNIADLIPNEDEPRFLFNQKDTGTTTDTTTDTTDDFNLGKKTKSQPDGQQARRNIFNIPDENIDQFKEYMTAQAKELAEALKDKVMKSDDTKAEEEKAKELLKKMKEEANKKSTAAGDGGVDPTAHSIIKFLKKRDEQMMQKQKLKDLDDNQHFINARDERIMRQQILEAKLQEGGMANAARLAAANRRKTMAVMQNRRLNHVQSKGEAIILPMNTISHNMAVGTS